MNDSSAGVGGYKFSCHNSPCYRFENTVDSASHRWQSLGPECVKRGEIRSADKCRAEKRFHRFQSSLELFLKRIHQHAGNHKLHIGERIKNDRVQQIGAHRGKLIGRERPRSGRPRDKVPCGCLSLIVRQGQGDKNTRIGDLPISLANFASRQSRSTLSPPPDNLVPSIELALSEECGQCPPDAFNVALLIRSIRVAQVDPKSDSLGKRFPFLHVTPDRFLATMNEWLNAISLDFFL